jgi:hypothetical protein
MPKKGVIGFICILTGVIGYLAFGWIGVAVGPLTGLTFLADRYIEKRRSRSRTAGLSLFRPGRRGTKRSTSRNKARLEALLARAHLLADTFHDPYGARNCCLDIIRQTDKEDPLFIAAYDLFMRTATGRTDRPPTSASRYAASRHRLEPQTGPRDEARVIRFPPHVSRP